MSERFPGGVISKTAPVPTGPFENGTAPGIWTLEQQAEFVKQGIWPIAGNVPPYIEDVFSTWLYTGSGGTNAINNGIDLAGKGGMVWAKARNLSGGSLPYEAGVHLLYDTNRGVNSAISSNSTSAAYTDSGHMTSFNSNGFTLAGNWEPNEFGYNYVSWSFREQAKFFDIVTYTGNGSSQNIAHNLGSVPGCIIVKDISNTRAWSVYHTSLGNTQNLILSGTNAAATATDWNNTSPTTTQFTVGNNVRTNASGATYVAYLFAHNAGGFGLTGTDNVISCGSYTGNGSTSGPTINLGYEPQWILLKNATTGTTEWVLLDNMRGMAVTGNSQYLRPNSSGAESGFENFLAPTATGFQVNSNDSWINSSGNTYIYIAIRRGPMKPPTTGTSVFNTSAFSDYSTTVETNILTDFVINKEWFFPEGGTFRTGNNWLTSRLGGRRWMATNAANNEFQSRVTGFDRQNGYSWEGGVGSGYDFLSWAFRRAPSFADVVCYTGNDVNRTISHNLAAVPEMIITKNRDSALEWAVYHVGMGNTRYMWLNSTAAQVTASTYWNDTTPTSSVFTVGTSNKVNSSPSPYVAYLFTSCPGVSKVGSYTGTGTTQTINCGFTGGARFILIKRTNAIGDWFVYDSYRGIQAGNDPYLLLNSSNAQVSNTNFVDTDATGFQLIGGGTLNASGGTYIFLAIA